MKKLSMYTLVVLLATCVLPTIVMAQNSDKEFYGKPSYWRPYDQTGINVFETNKVDTIAYQGPRIRFGTGFTMQFQDLKHSSSALNNTTSIVVTGDFSQTALTDLTIAGWSAGDPVWNSFGSV